MTPLPGSTGAILTGGGGETLVAGKRQELLNELWNELEKCHRDNKQQAWEEFYAGVVRPSAGSRSKVGDEVVVREEGGSTPQAGTQVLGGVFGGNRTARLQNCSQD